MGIREFLQTSKGKTFGLILLGIGLLTAIVSIWMNWSSPAESLSNDRIYISASDHKVFRVTLKPGLTLPVTSPNGNKDGWPAELCYWNKDGTIKTEPTPVLVNQYIGKPGPTFCPDCGRLVVPHNPPPNPGLKPPPTKAEYKPRVEQDR